MTSSSEIFADRDRVNIVNDGEGEKNREQAG
jgi:hypothetical protein